MKKLLSIIMLLSISYANELCKEYKGDKYCQARVECSKDIIEGSKDAFKLGGYKDKIVLICINGELSSLTKSVSTAPIAEKDALGVLSPMFRSCKCSNGILFLKEEE